MGKGGSQTIGYKHMVGMHIVDCHGPIDKYTRFSVDDRTAWEGEATGGSIAINAPELFGGEGREGGISGIVDILMGSSSQLQNDYLQSKVDPNVPAFRGVSGVVLRQLYYGNNPYLKPWKSRGQRIYLGEDGAVQWYSAKAGIPIFQPDEDPDTPDEVTNEHHETTNETTGRFACGYTANHEKLILANGWNFEIWDVATRTQDYAGTLEGLGPLEGVFAASSVGIYADGRIAVAGLFSSVVKTFNPDGTFFTSVASYNAYGVQIVADGAGVEHLGTTTYNGNTPFTFDDAILDLGFTVTHYQRDKYGNVWIIGREDSGSPDRVYFHRMVTLDTSQGYAASFDFAVPAFPGVFNLEGGPYMIPNDQDDNFLMYWNNSFYVVDPVDGEIVGSAVPIAEGHANLEARSYWTNIEVPATSFWLGGTEYNARTGEMLRSYPDIPTDVAGDIGIYDPINNAIIVNTPLDWYFLPVPRILDMNGAHIIRECLTNSNWGMGYTDDDIDDDSFSASADTLYGERLGISLLWDKQTKIEDFINEIVRHIDAALFVSRTTGKFVLNLIRNDYDPDDLVVLDETNILKISSPSRPAPDELVNSVTVNYWNTFTGKEDSVTVDDVAMVQMNAQQPIATTVHYEGFTHKRTALIGAQRDLRSLSTAFLSCTIYADRTAKDLVPGAPFKFRWSKWHISETIMRVTGIAFGDGKSNQVRINCVEDVFATSLITMVNSDNNSDWVDPSQPPSTADDGIATEAPYYELAQGFGQANVDSTLAANPEIGFVFAASPRALHAINAELWTDDGSGMAKAGAFDFCASALLVGTIGKTDTTVNFDNGEDLDYIEIGDWFILDDEICRIDALNTTLGTMEIGRGCLDTVPAEHADGARMLFADNYNGYDPTEYVAGETIDVKIRPASGAGLVSLADASTLTVEMDQRAFRPYAPGDLRINGDSYLDTAYSGLLTIDFTDRDRTMQTGGTIYDHTFGDIGPEAGVEYRIRFYLEDVLVLTEEPATSGFAYAISGEGLARVEVDAKRDGVYSWQAANHEFLYSGGDFLAGEEGGFIVGEYGEYIVSED